jgi:histidyl-tRNA synthetase
LKLLNIKFTVDPTLVRGLDYYTNFIFEVNATDERLKGQPTIVGGGRYAHLVAELGGEDCSCIGFALGIERLALALEYENQELQLPLPKTIDVVVANLDAEIDMPAVFILQYLRASGIAAVCKFSTHKLVKCFEYAEALQAKFVVIVSERDIAENKLTIKDQRTLRQEVVEIDKISAYIKERI